MKPLDKREENIKVVFISYRRGYRLALFDLLAQFLRNTPFR